MNRSSLSLLAGLTLGLAFSLPGVAADAPTPEEVAFKPGAAAWIVSMENDKFFAGTDRHYTQGAKFTRLYNRAADGPLEKWLSTQFQRFGVKLSGAKIARSIGQDIFTPGNTDTAALIPNDRPYAGWLYYSIGYHAIVDDNRCWIAEATAGIVGPSAQGEFAQNGWHDVIGVPHANGWANQLHDEPGFNFAVEHRWRLPGAQKWWDVVPRTGLVLGNVNTHLSAGGALRIGLDLPEDFGYDLIRAGSGNVERPTKKFSAYFFAAMDTRLVARNIFLDGNTWRDSHSVRKRPVVWDGSVGIALTGRSFKILYTQNYRSKDFYGQVRRDVFGSIAIAWLK